jgi:site-specific recombinase XerD
MPKNAPNGPAPPLKAGTPDRVRSLPVDQWPAADRSAWVAACRPAERLRRGGAASHMREVTRRDLARRYGYFLDHVERTDGLSGSAGAAVLVTPPRVGGFLAELQARVGSVTVHGSISKLRRMAQLLAPRCDYSWLVEIENDLALVMRPKSKTHRLVYASVTAEAGMTLMAEAEAATHRSPLARARQFRDGLMVSLLAFHPIRLKNFAALEIGRTFVNVRDKWWIVLTGLDTKEKRPDERGVDEALLPWIERYLTVHRPVLARGPDGEMALWLSSNNGHAMSYTGVEQIISSTTKCAVGVDVSPHLFRTGGVSSCAVWAGDQPYLGSALAHHTDAGVTNEHYNRASTSSAAQKFGNLIRGIRQQHPNSGRRRGSSKPPKDTGAHVRSSAPKRSSARLSCCSSEAFCPLAKCSLSAVT